MRTGNLLKNFRTVEHNSIEITHFKSAVALVTHFIFLTSQKKSRGLLQVLK